MSIISIFKIDLAGKKGLIELELRYEMDIITFKILLELQIESSGAGEFHPNALQEPYVTVSRHTAPTVQPTAENQIPKTQIVWVHGVLCDLTNGSP